MAHNASDGQKGTGAQPKKRRGRSFFLDMMDRNEKPQEGAGEAGRERAEEVDEKKPLSSKKAAYRASLPPSLDLLLVSSDYADSKESNDILTREESNAPSPLPSKSALKSPSDKESGRASSRNRRVSVVVPGEEVTEKTSEEPGSSAKAVIDKQLQPLKMNDTANGRSSPKPDRRRRYSVVMYRCLVLTKWRAYRGFCLHFYAFILLR